MQELLPTSFLTRRPCSRSAERIAVYDVWQVIAGKGVIKVPPRQQVTAPDEDQETPRPAPGCDADVCRRS
jgi:hypothetical protein